MFKVEFEETPYIKVLPKIMAQQMVRFRCTNSKIPADVTRFNNVPDTDLKCTLCNIDITCDELHLLFECVFFENVRLTYLGRRRFRNINCIFFRDIMENRSAIRLSKLSKFMSIIMNVFK